MTLFLKHIGRFLVLGLLQVLIFNQAEIGWGLQFMPYPLFIFLLPIETGVVYLLLIAFGYGMFIDSLSDSYGLHTSAILVFAYLKPMIMKLFSPRDGYESTVENAYASLGFSWFLKTYGLLLLIHHLWFFLLEIFKLNDLLFTLQKTGLSFVSSFILSMMLQFLLVSKSSKE
ncbi:MAG: hypothetical protein EP333_01450 [Bacteroidetes bacterium]|nr:MAG: hypothetical protein EP333_01450 [Bacteroidota bacterium]